MICPLPSGGVIVENATVLAALIDGGLTLVMLNRPPCTSAIRVGAPPFAISTLTSPSTGEKTKATVPPPFIAGNTLIP